MGESTLYLSGHYRPDSMESENKKMASFVIAIEVNFGEGVYEFEGAVKQLNGELLEQFNKISLGSIVFNEITNAVILERVEAK